MAEAIGYDFQFNTDAANKNIQKMADRLDKFSTFGIAKSVAIGQAMASAFTAGFNFLKSKASAAMPFVTQTFDQLSTVFFNNLFRPLQSELMPALIRLSNWVAENRVNFVKLGTVLVSIFKAAWTIISNFFGMIKEIADRMFEGIFGKGKMTFDRFLNFINLILLKIVFVFMFIQQMIEPLINGIGDLLASVFNNAVMPFFEGFGEGFSEWVEPISEAFKELGFSLTDLSESLNPLKPIFKFLGYVIGNVIGASVWFVIKAFKTLIDVLKLMFRGVGWLMDFGRDIKDGIGNAVDWVANKITMAWNSVKNAFAVVWDWIKDKFDSLFDGRAFKFISGMFGGKPEGGNFSGAGSSGGFVNTSVAAPSVAGASMRQGGSRTSNYNGGSVTINVQGGDPAAVRQAVQSAVVKTSYANQFYKEAQAKGLK